MHDEFEQAMTGRRPRKGPPVLAWIFIIGGFLSIAGIVTIALLARTVVNKVEEVVREIDFRPDVAASEMIAKLESHTALLSAGPDEGLAYLRDLGDLGSSDPSDAILEQLVSEPLQSLGKSGFWRDRDRQADPDTERASFRARSDEGEVSLQFERGEAGGSLVISTPDGDVRFDLTRTRDGGFLTIDSDEGSARLDLKADDDGGSLTITSDEGEVRFDVRGDEDGGRFVVRTDGDEVLQLAVGDDAVEMPGWVPQVDGMPRAPRPVYSLSADEGVLGAVSWRTDDSAQNVLESFEAELEDLGYELKADHNRTSSDLYEGSLWARDEDSGRIVFVVAHDRHDRRTVVTLGYGESDR